jgi:hypothetical protein
MKFQNFFVFLYGKFLLLTIFTPSKLNETQENNLNQIFSTQ